MKKVSKYYPLISVIIPVYNVEKYLDRCVQSVVDQTYKNLEIILVDDGSLDNCPLLCDNWMAKDNRIKVIHKSNGGLSDARNRGLEESNGKYITFIDSDDYVDERYVEYLKKLIVKYSTDLSISSYKILSKKVQDIGVGYKEDLLSRKDALKRLVNEEGFTVSACAKMYRKNLFDYISFPVGKLYEDNATIYKLIMKCDKIAYGNKSYYFYCLRKNSITRCEFNVKKMDAIEMTSIMCDDISKKYSDLSVNCMNKKFKTMFGVYAQMCSSKLSNNQNAIIRVNIFILIILAYLNLKIEFDFQVPFIILQLYGIEKFFQKNEKLLLSQSRENLCNSIENKGKIVSAEKYALSKLIYYSAIIVCFAISISLIKFAYGFKYTLLFAAFIIQ